MIKTENHTITFLIFWILLAAISFCQEKPSDILNHARLLMMNGKYKEASQELNSIVQKDPTNEEALYNLGLSYQSMSDFSNSADALNKAIKYEPEDTRILIALGNDYYSSGTMDEAESVLSKAFLLDSTSVQIKLFLGKIYMAEKKWERALEIYSGLAVTDSTNSYFYEQLGKCKSSLGDIDGALVNYKCANRLNPKNLNTILDLSYLLYLQKQLDSAINVVDAGLNYFPHSIELWNRRGDIYFIIPNYDQAIFSYSKAWDNGDTSASTQKNIGICYYWEKDYDSAKTYLEKSIELNNKDAIAYFYLGASLKEQKQYKTAIDNFKQAASLLRSEFLSNVYGQIGAAYQLNGKYCLAADFYQDALRENPTDRSMFYYLAFIYDKHLNEKNVALNYYKKFLISSKNVDEKLIDYAKRRLRTLTDK
ncbi:MAG: tetratricopeptide repeat protein [Ignavibacteriaceae bacterium]